MKLSLNKKTLSLSLLFLISIIIFSCAKDKSKNSTSTTSTPNTPSPNCDTVTFAYNAKVKNIINSNCSGCHSSGSSNGYLLDHASLKAAAVSGSLKNSLNGTGGYSQMPPSGKLSNCDVKGIENWITAGSQNN
jgi:hypothetical protein